MAGRAAMWVARALALVRAAHAARSALSQAAGDLSLAALGQAAPCRDLLRGVDIKLQGNFAVVPVAPQLVDQQVAALAGCGWLAPDVDTLVLTLTDDAAASRADLQGLSRDHRVVVMDAGRWPGNLEKVLGYATILAALQRGGLPARARLLLSDCCDVLFREDAPCRGDGDIFERFSRQSKRVVWGVERGSSMLMSTEAYLARVQQAVSLVQTQPPEGWMVEVRDPADQLLGAALQKRLRPRYFAHTAADFAPSPLFAARGLPDLCTGIEGRCLHAKLLNSGLVMGDLDMLAQVYSRTLQMCGARCHGTNLTGSDQNVVSHYLLTSGLCEGNCGLDHNFTLFHNAFGFKARDYQVRRVAGDAQSVDLQVRLPALRSGASALERHVWTATDWIALSPKHFERTWVSVPACAVHVNGLPGADSQEVYSKLRQELKVDKPYVSFVQEALQRFYAARRKRGGQGGEAKPAEVRPTGRLKVGSHAMV